MTMAPSFITAQQAADFLGVTKKSFHILVERYGIPFELFSNRQMVFYHPALTLFKTFWTKSQRKVK